MVLLDLSVGGLAGQLVKILLFLSSCTLIGHEINNGNAIPPSCLL